MSGGKHQFTANTGAGLLGVYDFTSTFSAGWDHLPTIDYNWIGQRYCEGLPSDTGSAA
jgi:hypothetical protein